MPEGFKIAAGYVTADIDTEGLKERAQAKIDEALSGVQGKVPVGLDMARLDADADRARERIASLSEEHAEAQLGLDSSAFDTELDHAREKFDQFHEAIAKPRLGLDDDDFREKIDRDKADLDGMGAKKSSPKAGLDDDEFKAKLASDRSSFSAFGAMSISPMIAGLTGGISALLPGIGAGVAGLGLLGGGLGLAFGPVLKALQAHQQGTQQAVSSSGQTTAQLAATAFSNAVAIQQAQQAVQQAMQQSAQDAKTSAQAIISAEQQVGQAEQQLGDAQFGVRDAQVNLTNARIQARLTLEQLDDAEKDSVLSTRSAKLSLAQAQQQQTVTDQNAMSTQLDRQQAALAVAQAQRQVTEAEQNQVNSKEAANRADKAGVDGSQQVVDAQHALLDSVNAVKDAEQALMNARRGVAQAEEQAAYQAKRDAEALKQAEQNVTDTIKEQQLAMAATLAQEQSAMAQFGADYQKLTPQAQAFVSQLLDAGKAFHGLQDIAERTILPGASEFLRGLMKDMPVIKTAVGDIGRVISKWFSAIGREISTPAFQSELGGLFRNGIKFVSTVVPAIGKFVGALAQAGSKKGAASALSDVLGGIADGLTGIVKGVEPFIPQIDKFFGSLSKLLGPVGTLLGDTLGGIATIAAPLMTALLPGIKSIVVNLGPSLDQIAKSLAPAFKGIGVVVSQILETGSPILEFIAHVVGWLRDAGNLMGGISDGNGPAFVKTLSHLAGGFKPLISIGKDISKQWDGVRDSLMGAWNDITGANGWGGLGKFFGGLLGVTSSGTKSMQGDFRNVQDSGLQLTDSTRTQTGQMTGIWGGFKNLFQSQTGGLTVWVATHWDNFLAGVKTDLHLAVSALSSTWHGLEADFRGPVDYLINTVYTQGIRRLWDDVVGAVGLGSLKLPPISGFASGGIHPGRDTGHDDYLVRVRGGEGFLAPETVRAIGPGTVSALNSRFAGGGTDGTSGGLPGFKHGGILGVVDRGLDGLIGGAKFAAELVINPAGAITSLLDKAIGTNATGNMGDVMKAIPHVLITDLAKSFAQRNPLGNMGYGTQGGLGGTATGRQIVNFAESFIGKVPYVWGGTSLTSGVDCSGYAMDIYEHFGFQPPRTSETQWDWVQRTPTPVLGGLAFFAGGDGTVSSPGHVGIVTGTDQMVDAYGTGFGVRLNSIYTSSGGVSGFGVPPGGGLIGKTLGGGKGHFGTTYDSGGWLMPGPVNQTSQPEAVLTPEESRAFVALVRQWTSQGGGAPGGRPQVNFNYFGTQYPTAEQQAIQRRDLAMMLGG